MSKHSPHALCTFFATAAALLLSATPIQAADDVPLNTDFTDIWASPSVSGWGVNFVQRSDFIFATLSLHDAEGKPIWYTSELLWHPAELPVYVDGRVEYQDLNFSRFEGPLYTTASTPTSDPFASGSKTTRVGKAMFVPQSAASGKLTLTIGDQSFEKNIQRLTLTRPPLSMGQYSAGSFLFNKKRCRAVGDLGITACEIWYFSSASYVSFNPSDWWESNGRPSQPPSFTFMNDSGENCSISGPMSVNGPYYEIKDGRYLCKKTDATITLDTAADLLVRISFFANGSIEGSWQSKEKDGYSESVSFTAVPGAK